MKTLLTCLLILACSLAPALPVFAATATLTWQDNSTNESVQTIQRKAEACSVNVLPFTDLATVGPNIVTYTDTTVIEGQTYCYRLNASNPAGVSPYSNTDGKTVGFTVPLPQSNVKVVTSP